MRKTRTDRMAPGVGTASLQYYDDKFHRQMMLNVKSRVGTFINDSAWRKHKQDLTKFKKETRVNGQVNRDIDKQNLKMFVKLSNV